MPGAESSVVALPKEGSLEARLSAATAEYLPQLRGKTLPTGSPAVVIVTPAAMDAVHLIRKLPTFNKVGLYKLHASPAVSQGHLHNRVHPCLWEVTASQENTRASSG